MPTPPPPTPPTPPPPTPPLPTRAPSSRLPTQGLLAAAGLVAVVTLAARAVGILRWFVFSDAVGTTCVGQVYNTANLVPNVLFEVAAGGALAAVAVPLVAGHLQTGREDLADRTASALLTWTLTVLLPLAAVVALAAGPVTAWLLGETTDCDPAAIQAAGRLMLLLFAPQIALYGVGIVLAGVLQAHRRFFAAALAPLLSSLVVICIYLAFGAAYDATAPVASIPARAIWLLAGGTTVGVVALSLPMVAPAVRLGIRWRPSWRFPVGTGRRAGTLVLAGVTVVAGQQLATVVTVLLTNSSIGVGGITVWTYAQTVYLLPYAVLVVPLATAAFPRLVGQREEATTVLRSTLLGVVVAAATAAVALIAVRREVGGAFLLLDVGSEGSGQATLQALPPTLALLAPGLVGFALVAVCTRALYAVGSPRRAAAATCIGWGVAALLPVLLVAPGTDVPVTLARLAVGSSVGMSVAGLLLVLEVHRSWGSGPFVGVPRAGLSALAGASVALAVREVFLPTRTEGWVPTLGLAGAIGLMVLVGAAAAVRVLAPDAWAAIWARMRR